MLGNRIDDIEREMVYCVQMESGWKIKRSEIVYYLLVACFLIPKGIGLYDGQAMFKVFLLLGCVCWIIKIILTSYTKQQIFGIFALIGLTGVVYLNSGEKGAFMCALLITGLKNISLERLMKWCLGIWSLFFGTTIWIHMMKLIVGPFKVHEKFGSMLIRWGLGYSHPNVLHISFLAWLCMLLYVIWKNYRLKYAVVLMMCNLLIYIYSLSNTGFLAAAFLIIGALYVKMRGRLSILEKGMLFCLLPFSFLYSILLPLAGENRLFLFLNEIVNTRLELARHFLLEQPITLFGTDIAAIITNKLTMDNSYVNIFVTYGLIMFIVFYIAYGILMYRYLKENRNKEVCIIGICLLAGLLEPFLLNTSMKNISLYFMKDILFVKEERECITLLSKMDKEYSIHTVKNKDIKKCIERILHEVRMRELIIVCLIGIFIAGGFALVTQKSYEAVYVPKQCCDLDHPNSTPHEYITDFEMTSAKSLIYGYIDENEPMMCYTDLSVSMEQYRRIVMYCLNGGLITGIIYLIYKDKRR